MSRPDKHSSDGDISRSLASTICGYFDGTLSRDQLRKLESRLLADVNARRFYLELSRVHSSLEWRAVSREVSSELFAAEGTQNAPSGNNLLIRNRVVTAAMILGFTALAASLLVAVLSWKNPSVSEAELMATSLAATVLEHSKGARWVVLRPTGHPTEMQPSLNSNEALQLTSGWVTLQFGEGAEVTLADSAVLQAISPERAVAIRGQFSTHVSEESIGFSIDTPRATIVDLGTRFEIEVDEFGRTDVIVSEGEVDLSYGPTDANAGERRKRKMRMGEAVRVDGEGNASRIVSLDSNRFAKESLVPQLEAPTISHLVDNIREEDSWSYYEIVQAGLAEDTLAFVDRLTHEWNGVDAGGLPAYLRGADYVKTFNNDKVDSSFEIEITLSRPGVVYVFFDDRVPTPQWLQDGFEDTGDNIGLDCGPFRKADGKQNKSHTVGEGPGMSIDMVHSVWARRVDALVSIKLGPIWSVSDQPVRRNLESVSSMYGIAVAPLPFEEMPPRAVMSKQ